MTAYNLFYVDRFTQKTIKKEIQHLGDNINTVQKFYESFYAYTAQEGTIKLTVVNKELNHG